MGNALTMELKPSPATQAGPDANRNATSVGARGAPQQSPILRGGALNVGAHVAENKANRVPRTRKTPGVRGLAPETLQRNPSGQCRNSLTGSARS